LLICITSYEKKCIRDLPVKISYELFDHLQIDEFYVGSFTCNVQIAFSFLLSIFKTNTLLTIFFFLKKKKRFDKEFYCEFFILITIKNNRCNVKMRWDLRFFLKKKKKKKEKKGGVCIANTPPHLSDTNHYVPTASCSVWLSTSPSGQAPARSRYVDLNLECECTCTVTVG
jgi:hypothetical protein